MLANKTESLANSRNNSHHQIALGQENDHFEQEADQIADRVVMSPDVTGETVQMTGNTTFSPFASTFSSSASDLQMKCESCEEEEEVADQPATNTLMMAGGGATDDNSNIQEKEKGGMPSSIVQRKCHACAEQDKVQLKPYVPSHIGHIQAPEVQQKCEACKRKEDVQLKPQNRFSGDKATDQSFINDRLSSQIRHAASGGMSLEQDVQMEMSYKIGADFSDVRIHTDYQAVNLNKELGARAFTFGNHIFFGQGEYNPNTTKGKHLLAHELVHTVQQRTRSSIGIQREPELIQPSEEQIGIAFNSLLGKFGTSFKVREVEVGQGDWGADIQAEIKGQLTDLFKIVLKAKRENQLSTCDQSEVESLIEQLSSRVTATFKQAKYVDENISGRVSSLQDKLGKWVEEESHCDMFVNQDGSRYDDCSAIHQALTSYVNSVHKSISEETTYNYLLTKKEPLRQELKEQIGQIELLTSPKNDSKYLGALVLYQLQTTTFEVQSPAKREVKGYINLHLKEQFDFDLNQIPIVESQACNAANPVEQELLETPAESAEDTETKELSELEKDILRANEILSQHAPESSGDTADIMLALSNKASENGEAGENLTKLNETLDQILKKNSGMPEDRRLALQPIDISQISLFNEMMMLEGLLAGAGMVSDVITGQAIELKKNIRGFRKFIIEEIMWLAAEVTATAVISALLSPVSLGATAAIGAGRAAMLIYRINKLRDLLQRVQQVYKIYTEITTAINSIENGFKNYQYFLDFKKDIDNQKVIIDQLYEEYENDPGFLEQIETAEAKLINGLIKELNEGKLQDLLHYLRLPSGLPEEELAEEVESILLNIPEGIEAFHDLKTYYDSGNSKGPDMDFATDLAVKGVIAGALLYPFVGYMAEMVNTSLTNLMNEQGLMERFGDLLLSLGSGSRKRKNSSSKQEQREIQKSKLAVAQRGNRTSDKRRIENKQKKKQNLKGQKNFDYTEFIKGKIVPGFETHFSTTSLHNGIWTPEYFQYQAKQGHKTLAKSLKATGKKVTAYHIQAKRTGTAPVPIFKLTAFRFNTKYEFKVQVNKAAELVSIDVNELDIKDFNTGLPTVEKMAGADLDKKKKGAALENWLSQNKYVFTFGVTNGKSDKNKKHLRRTKENKGNYLLVANEEIRTGFNEESYKEFLGKKIHNSNDLPEGYWLDENNSIVENKSDKRQIQYLMLSEEGKLQLQHYEWWNLKKEFKTKKGEEHKVYFENEELKVASAVPTPLKKWAEKKLRNNPHLSQNLNEILALGVRIVDEREYMKMLKYETQRQEMRNCYHNIRDLLNEIAFLVALNFDFELPPSNVFFPKTQKTNIIYGGNRMTEESEDAMEVKVDTLSIRPSSLSTSQPGHNINEFSPLNLAIKNNLNNPPHEIHQGHVLNANVHGPGICKNLTSITKQDNKNMQSKVEEPYRDRILNDNEVFSFEAIVEYRYANNAVVLSEYAQCAMAKSIKVKCVPLAMDKTLDKWSPDKSKKVHDVKFNFNPPEQQACMQMNNVSEMRLNKFCGDDAVRRHKKYFQLREKYMELEQIHGQGTVEFDIAWRELTATDPNWKTVPYDQALATRCLERE